MSSAGKPKIATLSLCGNISHRANTLLLFLKKRRRHHKLIYYPYFSDGKEKAPMNLNPVPKNMVACHRNNQDYWLRMLHWVCQTTFHEMTTFLLLRHQFCNNNALLSIPIGVLYFNVYLPNCSISKSTINSFLYVSQVNIYFLLS